MNLLQEKLVEIQNSEKIIVGTGGYKEPKDLEQKESELMESLLH